MKRRDRRVKLIGLTGGVATGKSTVAGMFRRCGIPAVDTDELAHRLMRKGTREYKKIVALFGRKILNDDACISRSKIAKIVFGNTAESLSMRKRLEKILHPAIWRKVKKKALALAGRKSHLIVEIPLLFEVGWDRRVDLSIVVICSHKKFIERCKKKLRRRADIQLPLSKKAEMADFVIDSSHGRRSTFKKVRELTKLFKVVNAV